MRKENLLIVREDFGCYVEQLKQLVAPKQAAQICGVTPLTIRRWVSAKKLTPIWIAPRLVRFALDEVEAIAASRQTTSAVGLFTRED